MDVWMIVMICYPFSMVSFFTIIKQIQMKEDDYGKQKVCCSENFDEKTESISKSVLSFALWMVDQGLALLVTIFILLYFIIGILHSQTASVQNTCERQNIL